MKRAALTQSQAAEVLRESRVAGSTDARFLRAVDGRLCSLPHRLNDGDVNAAIVATLSTLSVTASQCYAQPKETADDT
jgi:hypothetical protein